MKTMKEIITTAENAKPFAEINGIPAYTFDDYTALAAQDNINNVGLDLTKFNADGTPARTNTKAVAVNVENMFLNRYRQVKKTLQVVVDYRCIKAQASGKIPYKQVPCYVISRDENGQLRLDRQITVSDNDFLSEFTHSLDRESMTQIIPLMQGDVGITKDKIAI